MTSLKMKYADEIAENMIKALGDNEFTNMFNKTASSKEEECMSEDCMEGSEMMACDVCNEKPCRCREQRCEGCGKMPCVCAQEVVAAEFALNKLVKIADTLDNKGFNSIANILDETMEKLAKKKEKAEKESKKEDKKSEKEDKKSKKEDKKSEKKDKKSKKSEKEDKENDEK